MKKVVTTIIIINGVLIKGIFVLREQEREDQALLKRAFMNPKRLEDGKDYAIEIWAKNTTRTIT